MILKNTWSFSRKMFNGKWRYFNTMHFKRFSVPEFGTRVVDLRSDTVTLPSLGMKKAMLEAEMGDDVYREDPTINELERKSAELFGKESAIFVPSGTMGNLIAILVHCAERASEIIAGSDSHIMLYEQTGAAQLGGINIREVKNNPDGTFDLKEMENKIRPDDFHEPTTALICVENTHNMCGGTVIPITWTEKLAAIAKSRKIPLHLDGARIFNASVQLGMPVATLTQHFQSVSVCLSKGLGCPIGTVLVGSQPFINKARKVRKVLGGAWRQGGMLAAAGIYALQHVVPTLTDDHRRTQEIANAIRELGSPYITVPPPEEIHSNILMVNINAEKFNAEDFTIRLGLVTDEERRSEKPVIVKSLELEKDRVRFVLHCNITDEDTEAAIRKIGFVIKEFETAENSDGMMKHFEEVNFRRHYA